MTEDEMEYWLMIIMDDVIELKKNEVINDG